MEVPMTGSRDDLLAMIAKENWVQMDTKHRISHEEQFLGEDGPVMENIPIRKDSVKKESECEYEETAQSEELSGRSEIGWLQKEKQSLVEVSETKIKLADVTERVKSLWKTNCSLITAKDEKNLLLGG